MSLIEESVVLLPLFRSLRISSLPVVVAVMHVAAYPLSVRQCERGV